MNRRAFLLAVGAAACGSPPRRPQRTPRPPPTNATPIASDFISAAVAPQTRPSPIAIHGSLLVQIAGDELSLWDTTTMTRTAGFVGAYRQACFLRDGTLAAFAVPPGEFKSELHRIDRSGTREVLIGPLFGIAAAGVTRVLPAGALDQIYVTRRNEIVLYRMTRSELQEVLRFRPSPTGPVSDQVLSLGDGRLLTTAGHGFEVIEPKNPPVRRDAAGRKPLLVAAASGDRIWYSHATGHWGTQVVLTSLGDPAAVVHALDFPSSRVTNLAAAGGALAVLVMSLEAPGGAKYPWKVVVFDETGAERWQVVLPEDIAEPGFSLGIDGFLAISADRVVLRGSHHALFAWDAKTGTRVGTS